MQFEQSTILGFFDSSQKTYEIPVYQRAYSWDEENWETFIEDLEEQIEGDNNYFYGNVLLEEIQKNIKYEIIDGQQRITTLTIFFRALINIFSERINSGEIIEIDLNEKESLYIKNNGRIKLRPVAYDQACFDSIIIENNSAFNTSTPSQVRLQEAKKYFEIQLRKYPTDTLTKILTKIEETELTIIRLEGKKDAALMFELENNRGKDLTNMEKIKSYFMYQMYVFSATEDVEANIEYIANIFKSIYLIINDLDQLTEDSILFYHNNAYINGFTYRNLEDVKNKFKKSNDKVQWIKQYVEELHRSFSNIKKFEISNEVFANKIERLNIPAYVYPFIIKAYKYNDVSNELNDLFQIMEIVTFRAKLINSRANIQERLNTILLEYSGDNKKLRSEIKIQLNQTWYWGDENTKNYLNGSMYGNNVIRYLLWEYEESIQIKGYSINSYNIENEQIEHISPQTPPDGEEIESGYDTVNNEYSEEFIEKRLNSLGNLMLISGSHNASIGNIPFKNKLNTYKNNPLLKQQYLIEKYAVQDGSHCVWKENSIIRRHKDIIDFSLKRWSL
ncbi:DUF262 domain-containing protein [Oceanispirochaeta crateris]|uniref:DUF262 domain-containing protein n=1 Tax=Oceanispirochaeta crateris TaxID=2518645 RepID=A0A5C1QJ60_9SPIO|nr:DUF262 domain-containing protein [Oceanispirochaeta crateris]QEN07328.1 DUF262 domain-containing protein [Oceanispirochaeta crateris]